MAANIKRLSKIQSFFIILTIALMVTIFLLSAQDADTSSNTSGTLTRIFVKLFFRDYDSFSPERQAELWGTASFIVRKLAHFSIYTALGFCASFTAGKRKLFSRKSLTVVLFGFFYALSDEVHQQFVKGRSCEFRDMMIDTGGVLTGMLISFVAAGLIALALKKRNDK